MAGGINLPAVMVKLLSFVVTRSLSGLQSKRCNKNTYVASG